MIAIRSSALFAAVGLLVLSFPHSARGTEKQTIAVLTGIGAATTMVCGAVALALEGDEDSESKRKEYARRGWLVGGALAYAVETYESGLQSSLRDDSGSDVNLSLRNSFGFKGRGGYRCHRYVSAELQVEWFDKFEGKIFLDGLGQVGTVDVEPIAITVNARAYLPIRNDRIQPFALFGAGLVTIRTKVRNTMNPDMHSDSRDTEFAIRFGGGVDFYATPNIVLTFETDYLQAFYALDDFDYVSIGLGVQYRF